MLPSFPRTCPAGTCPPSGFAASSARPCWCASLTTAVTTTALGCYAAQQPKVRVLTCACPLASRAACRPHGPLVQSALFRSSAAALRSPPFFARSRLSESSHGAQPKNRLYTAGPGPDHDSHCLTVLGLPGPPTDLSRGGQPALMTLESLFALACPAPLSVACLSFGFVDADLPDSRCCRCPQSVQPANTSLLTARSIRLSPHRALAGLRPASRRSAFSQPAEDRRLKKECCSSGLNDPARPTADRPVSTPAFGRQRMQLILFRLKTKNLVLSAFADPCEPNKLCVDRSTGTLESLSSGTAAGSGGKSTAADYRRARPFGQEILVAQRRSSWPKDFVVTKDKNRE